MVSESRRGRLLSIRMAGGESKVARPYETLAKKSKKRKTPKARSSLFEARALEPSEEVELGPKYRMKSRIHQYHLKVIRHQIPQRVNPHSRQVKLRSWQRPKMPTSSCSTC